MVGSQGSILTVLWPGPSTSMTAAATKASGGSESGPNPAHTQMGQYLSPWLFSLQQGSGEPPQIYFS